MYQNNKRPLSPHLTIYKPQLTSMLSITHRITGFALFIGALLLSWWIVLNAYGCGECVNKLVFSVPGRVFLFLWSLALYYHLLNGVRHLVWDSGKWLEIRAVYASGIAVIIGTILLTAASWLAVFYL